MCRATVNRFVGLSLYQIYLLYQVCNARRSSEAPGIVVLDTRIAGLFDCASRNESAGGAAKDGSFL